MTVRTEGEKNPLEASLGLHFNLSLALPLPLLCPQLPLSSLGQSIKGVACKPGVSCPPRKYLKEGSLLGNAEGAYERSWPVQRCCQCAAIAVRLLRTGIPGQHRPWLACDYWPNQLRNTSLSQMRGHCLRKLLALCAFQGKKTELLCFNLMPEAKIPKAPAGQ